MSAKPLIQRLDEMGAEMFDELEELNIKSHFEKGTKHIKFTGIKDRRRFTTECTYSVQFLLSPVPDGYEMMLADHQGMIACRLRQIHGEKEVLEDEQ